MRSEYVFPPEALHIQKLPDGGFVVSRAFSNPNAWGEARFACASIAEALKYIEKEMAA